MPTRRDAIELAASGLVLFGLGGTAFAAGVRDADAESFVISNANSTLQVLNDPKLSAAERTAKFSAALDKVVDMPGITKFSLGAKRTAFDVKNYAEYSTAFREYLLAAYQSQLDKYRGENVKLVGSEVRKPGDVVVNTKITQKRIGAEDLPVSWRVRKTEAGWKIFDVYAIGLWLAQEQRTLNLAALDQGYGKPEALIDYIRKITADTRAGKTVMKKKA